MGRCVALGCHLMQTNDLLIIQVPCNNIQFDYNTHNKKKLQLVPSSNVLCQHQSNARPLVETS